MNKKASTFGICCNDAEKIYKNGYEYWKGA